MKRIGTEFGASALAFTTVLAVSSFAHAQDTAAAPAAEPAPSPAPASAEASGSASIGGGASGGGAMTLPGAAPAPAQAVAGDSEHDQVIGTFGVGYLGKADMLIGSGPGATTTQAAPVVGVRYWVNELIGIDAGLGFGMHSSSQSANGQDNDGPSTLAFILHGGVPLALASAGHFTFEVIPELNVGFGSFSQNGQGGAPDQSGSGFHLDVGGRIGSEIHFGFMGLPKLALQASVGLAFQTNSTSFDPGGGAPEVKSSSTDFGTTVQDNPWNIFRSNVAALYYF